MSDGKNTTTRRHDPSFGPIFPFFFDDPQNSSIYTGSCLGHQDYFGGDSSSHMSFTQQYVGGGAFDTSARSSYEVVSATSDLQGRLNPGGSSSGRGAVGETNDESHPVSPNSSISASSSNEATVTEEDADKGKKEDGSKHQQQGCEDDGAHEKLKKV